jgi:nucleotide-binding universal stress UspA family protein
MKVLIGYDGSAAADDAITDLGRAGLPQTGEALVMSLADVFAPAPFPGTEPIISSRGEMAALQVQRARIMAEQALAEARALSEQGVRRATEVLPAGWQVRAEVRADTPHWALVTAAGDWGADLLVVGSRGRSALARALLGSVSQAVLHHAPCSVRIGRGRQPSPAAGPAPEASRQAVSAEHAVEAAAGRGAAVRLVLGIDGSTDSALAASAVADRTWPGATEVTVVGAIDARVILASVGMPPAPQLDPEPRSADAPAHALTQALDEVADQLRRAGLTATTTLLTGDAKRVILAQAERIQADCIVVGAKGHRRLKRLLLGSVSAAIAARAPCSVEVVRSG